MTDPRGPNNGYYTDVETSQTLGKSLQAVWKMGNLGQLPSKRIDGKRMYPKDLIDEIAAAKQTPVKGQVKVSIADNQSLSAAKPELRNDPERASDREYFSLGQVAYALNREQEHIDGMVRRGEVKAEKVGGKSWVSVDEMERVISKREPFRQARIRERLPKPQRLSTQRGNRFAVDSSDGKKSAEAVRKASNVDTDNSRRFVSNLDGFLPIAQEVDVSSTERVPTVRNDSQIRDAPGHHRAQGLEHQIQDLEKALSLGTEQLDRLREEVRQERECGEQALQEADRLREWIEDLQMQLLEEREKHAYLRQELEKERKENRYSPEKTRYEMDQLNAELENMHRYIEHLRSKVEEERELRQHGEERITDLQATLARSEARKLESEEALLMEKAELLRLREEKILLDKVRGLLGGRVGPLGHTKEVFTPASNALQEESDEAAGELVFQTQHKPWNFRPPFQLEKDEVELIQLVVGEYEITAEQIRRKKGRRAVEKLNDLLDRLLEAGVEPIKENDDRYSFDPDVLQS